MRSKLNKEDIKNIKYLLKLTMSIDKLYKKLYELEINNKKDSEDYKKNLDYLNIILEEEIKIYYNIKQDLNKINLYFNYISEHLNSEFIDSYNTILYIDNNNRVFYRILYKLMYELKISNYDDTDLPNGISNYMVDFLLDDYNYNTVLYDATLINKRILDDIIHSYLYFINDFIKAIGKEYNYLKLEKYNMAFINQNMECEMLENNFELPNKLDIVSHKVIKTLNIDEETFYEINNDFMQEDTIELIENILNIDKIELFENDEILNLVKVISLFRAETIMLDDDNIKYIVDYVYEDNDEKKAEHIMNYKIVNSFLKNIKKDKKRLLLSINKKKNG